MIGIRVVHAHMVELRNWKVDLVLPSRASIFTAPEAAVIARIDHIRIAGIDPNIMEIAMRVANRTETLSTVYAEKQRSIGFEDFILIFWIHDQIGEIKRPPNHESAGIQAIPRLATIVGAKQCALLRLDHGVHDLRFTGRYCHRDASPGFVG